jgi:hypothetical protein
MKMELLSKGMMMKLVRMLVVGMMFAFIHQFSTTVLQMDVASLVSSVNPDAGQAFSLITQNASNWTNISQTISNALNPSAR